MTDDPLAILAEMAERERLVAIGYVRDPQDVPRLLAVARAAFSLHERVPLYGNASTEDEPGNCPHGPDDGLHFEDVNEPGEWLCQGRPEGAVCSACTVDAVGERAPWPCDEYATLLGALTGRSAADVLAALTRKGAGDG